MANGIIDGNVLAALITLVALGMFAIWRDVGKASKNMDRLELKMDLLWRVSPFVEMKNGPPRSYPRRPDKRYN